MKIKSSTWLPWLELLALAGGCGQSGAPDGQKETLPVTVKLVQAKKGEITRSVSLPGNVAANQQAALYAKVGGYLKTIAVDKGDAVKAGAVLAEIEVPELLADQARYQAEVTVAEIDFRRISDAQKQAPDLVVRQAIDAARARHEVAKASLERAQTLLQFCKITAPFAGVVTRRTVDPGAFIPAATSGSAAPSQPLLTIADFSVVRVQIAVPEAESPFIRNGQTAKITVEELPGTAFTGTVSRFSHALDESTKTMLVEVDLPNPDGRLLPGMYATARLGVETKTDALLVPVDALVVEKAGSAVFTAPANKAMRIPVKTGFNDGTSVEILDGLKPGDSVILVGKRTFTTGQPITVAQ